MLFEELLPSACPVNKFIGAFSQSMIYREQPTRFCVTLGLVVMGSIKKQAEQAMESKP